MAVELMRAPIRRNVPGHILSGSRRTNLRLVSNAFDLAKISASKAAFNISMEHALLNKEYWDRLLEKLRKSGGGGGGGNDSRFDRVAVSMMLTNFLSNKMIQAMFRNFNVELFDFNKVSNQINKTNQIFINNTIRTIGKFVFGIVIGVVNGSNLLKQTIIEAVIKPLTNLLGLLSFQLNKLKEILDQEFKETIKKPDVKEKMKKIKEELLAYVRFFTNSFLADK